MIAKRVHFSGHVQGVGFRYLTKQIAMGFEVTGWVRNLPDGRVEVEVSAWEEEEIDDFLREIIESQLGGGIREMDSEKIESMEPVLGFSIR